MRRRPSTYGPRILAYLWITLTIGPGPAVSSASRRMAPTTRHPTKRSTLLTRVRGLHTTELLPTHSSCRLALGRELRKGIEKSLLTEPWSESTSIFQGFAFIKRHSLTKSPPQNLVSSLASSKQSKPGCLGFGSLYEPEETYSRRARECEGPSGSNRPFIRYEQRSRFEKFQQWRRVRAQCVARKNEWHITALLIRLNQPSLIDLHRRKNISGGSFLGVKQNGFQGADPELHRALQLNLSSEPTSLSTSSISPMFPQHRRFVTKGFVGSGRSVPPHIARPSYVVDGRKSRRNAPPGRKKTAAEANVWNDFMRSGMQKDRLSIKAMREASTIARKVLNVALSAVRAGVSTDRIDEVAHAETIRLGAYPSPLHYKGFPKSICISVNEVACHGIPDSTMIRNGDIVSVDVTAYFKGHHGDCAKTVAVGAVDGQGIKLMQTAREACLRGIQQCRHGVPFSMIGKTIGTFVAKEGFSVIETLAGHGIGREFHSPPHILHVFNELPGVMQSGMTFTVEPVVSEFAPDVELWSEDGWTIVTRDRGRTAQFEHTILIRDEGAEILTGQPSRMTPDKWCKPNRADPRLDSLNRGTSFELSSESPFGRKESD